MVRNLSIAVLAGFGLTVLCVYLAVRLGTMAQWVLLFPAMFLSWLVPGVNIGTPEEPVYEGNPVHLLAFGIGVVLQFILISRLYYWLLTKPAKRL